MCLLYLYFRVLIWPSYCFGFYTDQFAAKNLLSYLLDSCLHVKQNSGKVLTNHPSLMNFYLCPVNIWTRDCNGKPLQYSCLQNPMDGGAWWAAFHGVATSRSRLSDFTFTFHFHAMEKEMATHSSVLAWRISGTAEPGGLLSKGSHRVRHDWSALAAATYEPVLII